MTKGFLRVVAEGRRASLSVDLGYSVVEVPPGADERRTARLARSDVACRGKVAHLLSRLERNRRLPLTFCGATRMPLASKLAARTLLRPAMFSNPTTHIFPGNLNCSVARSMAAVNAGREEHDVDVSRDREIYGAAIGITRRLSQRVEAQVAGRYSNDRFLTTNEEIGEVTASIALLWSISSEASIRLSFEHIDGTGDDDSQDFVENVAYLGFSIARASRR